MLGQKFQKGKNSLGMKLNSKNNSLGVKIQPSNKLKSSLFSHNNEQNKKSYLEK